jgi:hypothetical protein
MIEESTYIPFQDGLLITPPYNINEEVVNYKSFEEVKFDSRGRPKCQYCGKPAEHANCHAHKDWCPYYCNPNPMSLNGEILSFSIIILFYILIKKFKK